MPGVVFALAVVFVPLARAQMLTLTANGNVFLNGTLSFDSSAVGGGFTADKAFDNLVGATGSGTDNGLIFANTASQLVAVTGFTPTSLGQISFYTRLDDSGRAPGAVHVYASTSSTTSLSSGSYNLDLGSFTLGISSFSNTASVVSGSSSSGYVTVNVSAPGSIQSVLLDFSGGSPGSRLTEIQAFPIPEPSTSAALAGLLVGSAALYVRRRRKSLA